MPFDPIQPARDLASIGNADLLVSMIELAVGVKSSGFGYDDVEALVREALSRMEPVAAVAPAKAPRKARKAVAADLAPSAADTMKASAKMRRAAEKQQPAMMWPGCMVEGAGGAMWPEGNPMREARKLALAAQGWVPGDEKVDGYMIWRKAGEVVRLGHYGMVYMGLTGWHQMLRADRETLTDAGKPLLAAQQAAEKRLVAIAEAKAKARNACRLVVNARKSSNKALIGNAKAEIRKAWKARCEARA